jgi:hypothetical protein
LKCGPYKPIFAYFNLIRKRVCLKEAVSWLKRGQKVPFLREICSPKKVPLKVVPLTAS